MALSITPQELQAQYWEPGAIGPVAQTDLSAWVGIGPGGPPVSIANAGSYQSGVIQNGGFKVIGLGCKSGNTGVVTLQRFLDRAGTVPVGAPVTVNLVAATSNWLTVSDGLPYTSFSFNISNTGAGIAAITNFGLLLTAA